MPAEAPLVSAIVASYNTRQMTLDCLRSLQAGLDGIPSEVWVVDNASTDGSADAIRESFPVVRVIANDHNAGFGAANNQAMAQAAGRYFLLLNSDAFPKPGAVPVLVRYLDEHPEAAVVGPRLLNADGSLQLSCYRFPSPLAAWLENLWLSAILPTACGLGDYRRWAHNEQRTVDWVVGACMLVRQEAFQQVGGFDEKFFMYAEETDWQRRMRDAGWQIAFIPSAEVVHLGGASGAAADGINTHAFDSLDYYQLKHHGRTGLVAFRLAMVVGCLLRAILWSLVALVPARRADALQKVHRHLRLLKRQGTLWHPAMRRAL